MGEYGTPQDTAAAVAATSKGSQQVQNDDLSEGQIMDCSLLVDEHEIDCFDDFNEGQGINHFDDQNSQSYSVGRLNNNAYLEEEVISYDLDNNNDLHNNNAY